MENGPPRYYDADHPREARTHCGHRCVSPHMIPRARETTCCILLIIFVSYLSPKQLRVCYHDRAIVCSTRSASGNYNWNNVVLDGRPNACRILRLSFFPSIFYLYCISILFVWRECLVHQVPIVLTVLSFRFSGLCLMVVNKKQINQKFSGFVFFRDDAFSKMQHFSKKF